MRRKLTKPGWIFLLILAASAAARVLLSVFPKTAVTYNDELFYLELAQNLFRRGTLTVYGTPLHFTKLLYSLLLSPFYAVKDGVLRTNLISAFNAVLVSSSLIPGYLLAKRVLKKTGHITLALLLLALSPNLLFSLTFMAENLYIPLLLWGVYAAYRFFASERKTPLHAFGLGLLAFVLFFAKQVGAAYAAAVLVVLLADKKTRKQNKKAWLLSLPAYALGAVLPYLLLQFTLFRNTGNIYSLQLSRAALSDWAHIRFFLAAAGRMLLEFGLCALFFPVALPLAKWKTLPLAQQALLLFSFCYVLFAAVGTAYAVSLPEEFASGTVLTNQRYCVGILFPFLLLFFAVLEDGPDKTNEPKPLLRQPLLWLTLAFALLTGLCLSWPAFASLVSSPLLFFTRRLQASPRSGSWLLLLRLGLPALFLLVLFLRNRTKQKSLYLLLPVFFAAALASDVFFVKDVTKAERIPDPEQLTEARQLDAWLDSEGGTTLVVAESSHDAALRLYNTLLDDEYLFVPASHFRNLAQQGTAAVNLAETPLPGPFQGLTGLGYDNVRTVDRIILLGDASLLNPDANEDITPEGISSLRILRPKDPSVLALRNPDSYVPGDTICFSGSGLSFRSYSPTGFSDTESDFTWTDGTEASLTLRPRMTEPKDLEADWRWQMTVGSQPCQIYANDTLVFDDPVSTEEGGTDFTVPAAAWADTGTLTLRFLFPEARQPNAEDTRLLAVAFTFLTLSEE